MLIFNPKSCILPFFGGIFILFLWYELRALDSSYCPYTHFIWISTVILFCPVFVFVCLFNFFGGGRGEKTTRRGLVCSAGWVVFCPVTDRKQSHGCRQAHTRAQKRLQYNCPHKHTMDCALQCALKHSMHTEVHVQVSLTCDPGALQMFIAPASE